MTVTSVFKVKVKAGLESQFESVLKELAATSKANETGIRYYEGFRSSTPGEYFMLESFADEAALEAHTASVHFQTLSPKVAECLDGAPELHRLTDI